MSYCRWSSDDWKSDIYCYQTYDNAWMIHVAGRRHIGELPPADHLLPDIKKWVKAHKKQLKALERVKYEDINLPYARKSFRETTLETCLNRLLQLRDIGYHVPDHTIEILRLEIKGVTGDGIS